MAGHVTTASRHLPSLAWRRPRHRGSRWRCFPIAAASSSSPPSPHQPAKPSPSAVRAQAIMAERACVVPAAADTRTLSHAPPAPNPESPNPPPNSPPRPVAQHARPLALPVIYPWDRRFTAWSVLTTAAAAFTAFLVPVEVAVTSGTTDAFNFANNPLAAIDAAMIGLFAVDMLVQSRVARVDNSGGGGFRDDASQVHRYYLASTDFLADLLGCLPLDWMMFGAAAMVAASGDGTALDPSDLPAAAPHLSAAAVLSQHPALLETLPALKMLYLVRLYRVRNLFTYLLFNLNVPLLWVTVMRNIAIVALLTHWVACAFWWEARHVNFDQEILQGVEASLMAKMQPSEQYVLSLYWAVTTLSMVEANAAPETMTATTSAAARASLFLLFNITLGSYILGTITLLLVKQDERTGKYRDQSANLREFTATHQLPAELKDSLQEHLRLHFDTSEVSEEQVLSVFPTAIRRRILRHLYMRHLQGCYLFEGAPQRLLDAILAAARVETFMPNVDIVSAGDYVNELFLLVSGTVEIRSRALGTGGARAADKATLTSLDDAEVDGLLHAAGMAHRGGTHRSAGVTVKSALAGELLGEAAFFTEVPQLEAIRSATVCRVLVVSRAAYSSLERAFPTACRAVLLSLQRVAEAATDKEFAGHLRTQDLEEAWVQFSSLQLYSWASTELDTDAAKMPGDLLKTIEWDSALDIKNWTPRQQLVAANLMRIRSCVQSYITKQEADRTAEFLNAAASGNINQLRDMLKQGCPPNSADYDGRCALELACVKGHADVVRLLLTAGANPGQRDNLGFSPLAEACKAGHDEIIGMLVAAGASLGSEDPVEDAKRLCSCVYVGDLPLLRRLLRSGLNVNAGDYDRRTALHISAAEGNLTVVRLLVEAGRARTDVTDRWGFTPYDEAVRVGAGPVVRYFEARPGAAVKGKGEVLLGLGLHGPGYDIDDDEEPNFSSMT